VPSSRHYREYAARRVYYLLSAVRGCTVCPCETRLIYDRGRAYVQERGPAHRIAGVIWAWAITHLTVVRAIWEILAAHDHNFHPIPVQLPRAYPAISCPIWARTYPPCSSYGPRPPLPARIVPRPRRTFLTHAVRCSTNSPRSFPGGPEPCARMSQSMTV
jgi:hypothetical protein